MIFFLAIFLLCVSSQNILQVAQNNGLTSLLTAVNTNNLATTLNGTGPFTVFAPTNTAFTGVNIDTASQAVADTLLYHVIAQNVASNTITNNFVADSALTGRRLFFNLFDGGVFVNGVRVQTADVIASNGRAHVIGTVLTPPSKSALEIAVESTQTTSLESLVIAAGLAGALNGSTVYTVFAPTDAAIAALPACVVALLNADPTGLLANILLYHVVPGTIFSNNIATGNSMVVPAYSTNGNITVTNNGTGVYLNNGARVITANILATNGVVHLIDQVILPPTLTVTCAPTSFSATIVAPWLLIVLSALLSLFL